jgi:membrane associated rhomboid family serine protease
MGLENRDYMHREPAGGTPFGMFTGQVPSATREILIAIALGFALQLGMNLALGPSTFRQTNWFEATFSLSRSGIMSGKIWQLATYAFLHEIGAFFLHIIFNCYIIYVFGRSVEARLGRAGLYRLFFASVIGGGVLWLLMSGPNNSNYMIGASAGAYGLIVAFSTLNPNRMLMLVFPPMMLPAKWLAIGIIGIEVLMVIAGQHTRVAWQAHFGGALVGYLMIRYGIGLGGRSLTRVQSSDWGWHPALQRPVHHRRGGLFSGAVFYRMRNMFRSLTGSSARHDGRGQDQRNPGSGRSNDTFTPDYIEREIDPILDKISAHGFQSLSRQERHKLEQFHRRRS